MFDLRIALISTGTSLFWISLYLYSPVLSIHARSLGGTLPMIGLIVASYAFGQIIFRIPIGIYADKFGRKPFVVASLVLSSLGGIWLGLSPDPWSLFAARTITGIAAAGWVAISVMYASFFREDNSTKTMAKVMSINSLSVLGATSVGGLMADFLGTSSTFFTAGILAAIGAIIIALISEPEYGKGNHGFKKSLSTITSPLLIKVSLVAITLQFVTFGVTFGFLPIFAENLGASKSELGFITTAGLISAFIFTVICPWITKRIGLKNSLYVASIFSIIALISIPFVGSHYLLIPIQGLNGAGRGLMNTALISLAIRAASPDLRATAMGTYQAIYALGMMLGPLISGIIASIYGIPLVFWFGVLVTMLGLMVISSLKIQKDQRY